MTSAASRILFRLTPTALVVANTGEPFTLRGLIAIVYGWTSTKRTEPEFSPVPNDREFTSNDDAQTEVNRLREEKRTILSFPNQRASETGQQDQTVQSHAGRALIELLQNAVDASRETPIGYKGLGFRSVLNLTDAPEIHSGHLHVR